MRDLFIWKQSNHSLFQIKISNIKEFLQVFYKIAAHDKSISNISMAKKKKNYYSKLYFEMRKEIYLFFYLIVYIYLKMLRTIYIYFQINNP